jgi:hypothetical protein
MRVLVLMMMCENDKNIARKTLAQFVEIAGRHELHVLAFDDASPSRCGDALAREFQPRLSGAFDVLVARRSRGFYRILENKLDMLRAVVSSGRRYDYVVKIDPDIHFTNRLVASVFDEGTLPMRGQFGPVHTMRHRDHVQALADMLPVGFRRRNRAGIIDHKWEFMGPRKVWWADIGREAWRRGWRGEFIPGGFYVLTWDTLSELARCGYLDRDDRSMGLVFGDDVVMSIMVKAMGHPIVSFEDLVPRWSCDMFVREGMTAAEIRAKSHAFVHPLKEKGWAQRLRAELQLES